jgi:hypothetical protein
MSTTSSCSSCTMRLALDPVGHRVPRTKPTSLSTPRRPARLRPFVLVLHLHQRKPSCNQHLQYQAKSQSTQRCQPLLTSALTTHHINNKVNTQNKTHTTQLNTTHTKLQTIRQSLITHGPRYLSTWFLNLPLDECIDKRRSKSKQELIQAPQGQ